MSSNQPVYGSEQSINPVGRDVTSKLLICPLFLEGHVKSFMQQRDLLTSF